MQRAPIFKGCTRPAMQFGVPLVPFILVWGVAFIGAVWLGFLVSWMLAIGLIIVAIVLTVTMRDMTKKDDQKLKQVLMRIVIRIVQSNHWRWRAISFSPIRYKRRKS
ncbi:type IV secretion system protein VirB3 [Burkholderia sp. Ac-20345]|uniref:type IV secretion system protein VirB3 n=1 Tax=Burkholderia sp. Ac-20345 TaxID=2703891 RepID=UPI00197C777E|nr:VirB3 family type IV secretion system protein [Burkholderia sp. Ac-20345]MBN3780514.1 type IV secretion system protein VirB3 [Burkholderia sp. Ac-20345]